MTGRPTKLTEELQQKLCRLVSAGNHINDACVIAGISKRTFENWTDRGRRAHTGKYRDFVEAIERAEAQAKARNVALIQKAAQEDWRAALEYLERRYPEEWGKRGRFVCREDEE